jgi:hypothetical protein
MRNNQHQGGPAVWESSSQTQKINEYSSKMQVGTFIA